MKQARADELIRRLRDRFAPGGLLHYGQGKWYPGEPLPRWAYALYWRKDGVPIWQRLIADLICQRRRSTSTTARNPATRMRSDCAQGIAGRLGIAADYVQPAFEDPAERMLKEGELPENIDPANPAIDDPIERARILRMVERHLADPAGFVLPVQPWAAQASAGWISEIWKVRRGRLFLVPGDSPIGLRLPLASLPYVRPTDHPYVGPADPFALPRDLPATAGA